MSSGPGPEAALAYDAVAADYARQLPDLSFEAASDVAWLRRWAADTRALQRREPSLLAVDAGSGTGRLYPSLLGWGLEPLVGVEPSEGMRAQAQALHPEGRWADGHLGSLPFEDGSCAGVLSWYSAIHLSEAEAEAAATECARVLAPGGWVLWGFHSAHRDAPSRQVLPDGTHLVLRGWNPGRVAGLLLRAGLRLVASGLRPAREGERAPQGMVLARAA